MARWGLLALVLLLAGCATGTPIGLRLAGSPLHPRRLVPVETPAGKPPVAPRPAQALASMRGGGGGPAALVARTAMGALVQLDAFEELLRLAGLDERDSLPVQGSPLTAQAAVRLLAMLLHKPMTLGNFPPRMAAGHLLREVLEGGEVSREEMLHRVERFAHVAVLRPDGYLAWARTGRTQQKAVGRLEWKDGAFHAGPLELGRFYVSDGLSFRLADARMQPVGSSLAEVYDDADVLGRSLDGAQESFFELAMAIGKVLTYPMDSLASLRHLPAGVAALIQSSPAYWERFKSMTRGEQIQAIAKLTTTLILTCESLAGPPRTVTGAMGGAEATVPVLTLSAEGALALERVVVPVGKVATAIGAGGLYVLSTASGGGGPSSKGSHDGGEAAREEAAAAPELQFPRSSLRGVSLKWLQRNKPSGWRQVPTRDSEGWIWLDRNGIERLRFMRPNGMNASASQWGRQSKGYFRWKDAKDNFLDVDGRAVSPSHPQFQELTHIPYEGL